MGWIAAAVAVAGVATATTSAVVGSQQTNVQKKAANQANDTAQTQQRLEAELAAKNSTDETDATAVANAAREKQRKMALQSTGRQDTILTGPLGVPAGQQDTKPKTILGS